MVGCGSTPERVKPVLMLSPETAARFPHHELLAEDLYGLAAEIRRSTYEGVPADVAVAEFLGRLPTSHQTLGRATRALEGAMDAPTRSRFDAEVVPYMARAQGALASALMEAREVEPESAARGAALVLSWLSGV